MLLLIGVVFHIIYSWSIFDIYFTSPIVHGMDPVETPKAPAKRLVLVVADGLRADKLFEDRMIRAPFLYDKAMTGSYGICHTRVPTESRPGHVALIAGFYEDVSAVTKGWKTNPVNFDSVFNQSYHSWSFGSPDILPMFALGASNPAKIEMTMYAADAEDFADDDASKLDTFVFDHFEKLIQSSKQNKTLFNLLHSEKIVFFLHLLGLDTNGHAHKPYSKEYLDNISLVDKGLEKVAGVIDDFYRDNSTSFVFASDHGMSNRGNHGDGHPTNTETPLIAWGAGIKKSSSGISKYGLLNMNDVNQADVAPLMSSLIGIPFPMNSEGKIPLAYISNTPEYKAVAFYRNLEQVSKIYLLKEKLKENTEFILSKFPPLVNLTTRLSRIEALILTQKYDEAIQVTETLFNLLLKGIAYYQRYDWLFLRSIVSFGYLSWIVYSTVSVYKQYFSAEKDAGISLVSFIYLEP